MTRYLGAIAVTVGAAAFIGYLYAAFGVRMRALAAEGEPQA